MNSSNSYLLSIFYVSVSVWVFEMNINEKKKCLHEVYIIVEKANNKPDK